MEKFKIIFIIFLAIFICKSYNSYAQESRLYFCEEYKNGEEIGVSDTFTPGWLTVMVDFRPANETIDTKEVEIRILKIKDASGRKIPEKFIDTVPFDVQPDWDYIFFEDQENLVFQTPGTYKVILQKTDGTPILEGFVKIVPE